MPPVIEGGCTPVNAGSVCRMRLCQFSEKRIGTDMSYRGQYTKVRKLSGI